jgi:hypothetical protein
VYIAKAYSTVHNGNPSPALPSTQFVLYNRTRPYFRPGFISLPTLKFTSEILNSFKRRCFSRLFSTIAFIELIVFACVVDVYGSPKPHHSEISDSNGVVPNMGGDADERTKHVSC